MEGDFTGFLDSSTSLILRFSRGIIPLGSLSWEDRDKVETFTCSLLTDQREQQASNTHSGVFKVVEAVVREDEPASLPGLHSST